MPNLPIIAITRFSALLDGKPITAIVPLQTSRQRSSIAGPNRSRALRLWFLNWSLADKISVLLHFR
jgi:hypothetical protein